MQITKELAYRPNSPAQEKFHKSEAFERALIMGYGGGKTKAGAAELIRLSIENAGCDSMAISPNFPMAKRTLIPTIKQILNDSEVKYSFNVMDKLFETEWGGKIWIGTGDVPESLKGANLSHAWVDEPFVQSERVYFEMLGRVREPRAKRLSLFLTGTPEGMGWGYEEFVNKEKPNREIIWGKTFDNPALPKEYIENLKSRYDSRLQLMYLEGQFLDFGQAILNPEWFQYYDTFPDLTINFVCDTAYGKKNSDNSVILAFGTDSVGNTYIRNLSVVNLTFPDFLVHLENFVKSNGYTPSSRIFVEPKATGISVVQTLRSTSNLNIMEDTPPTEAKVTRMIAQTSKIESGRCFLPRYDSWVRNFLHECAAFPGRLHDDSVDCLEMALRKSEVFGNTAFGIPRRSRHLQIEGYDTHDLRGYDTHDLRGY